MSYTRTMTFGDRPAGRTDESFERRGGFGDRDSSRGGDVRRGGGDRFDRDKGDRFDRGGGDFFSQFGGSLPMQPSLLGFVAKQEMPMHLSILFRARPPLEHAKPIEKGKCKPLRPYFDGLRDYMALFEDNEPPKPRAPQEKADEKKERIRKEKLINHLLAQKQEMKKWTLQKETIGIRANTEVIFQLLLVDAWNPYKDTTIKSDPYRTLFVSNLSFKTDEKSLREAFEPFGRIRRIRIVVNKKTGKPRGYAFIEYDNESDFQLALDRANGRKVDGRRVVVDYERGRTKQEWVPRRLGGGKGGDKRRDRDLERLVRDMKKREPLLQDESEQQAQVKREDNRNGQDTQMRNDREEIKAPLKQEPSYESSIYQKSKPQVVDVKNETGRHSRSRSRSYDGRSRHYKSSRAPEKYSSKRDSRDDSRERSKKDSKKDSRKDSKKDRHHHHKSRRSMSSESDRQRTSTVTPASKEAQETAYALLKREDEVESEPGEIE